MTDTITFRWTTGKIEIAACAVLNMSATQLKNLVRTATANAEEVKNQIEEYIQSEIAKLNPKSEYDKKMIGQYNKLIAAAVGERRQTAQEKAIARILKNCTSAMADKYMGVIHDAGMYCVLDGFRLVRYSAPLDNFPKAAQTFDTNRAIGDKSRYNIKLVLPSVKELKADMKIAKLAGEDVNRVRFLRKGKHTDFGYDFGCGLPLVNAKWLIDMIEALPDASAYAVEGHSPNPIYFTDGTNDGIILAIRRANESNLAPAVDEAQAAPVVVETPVEAAEDPEVNAPAEDVVEHQQAAPKVKNLAQLKNALSAGYAFKIVKHYIKPELSGQIRKPSKVQTNAVYTVIPGEPNNPVSLANDGKGYYLSFGKAGDWTFNGDTIILAHSGKPVWEITFDLSYPVEAVPAAPPVNPAEEERKRRAEQERIEREQAISAELEKAEQAIINGGYIENKLIDGKLLFLRLFDKYNVNIPIRSRGWIIDKLRSVTTNKDGASTVYFRTTRKGEKVSQGFCDAYFELRRLLIKAQEEAEKATASHDNAADNESAAAIERVQAVYNTIYANYTGQRDKYAEARLVGFKTGGFFTEDFIKALFLFPVRVSSDVLLAIPPHEEAQKATENAAAVSSVVAVHPAVLRRSAGHYKHTKRARKKAITPAAITLAGTITAFCTIPEIHNSS